MVNTADESSLQSIRPPQKGAEEKKGEAEIRGLKCVLCCLMTRAVIQRSKAVLKNDHGNNKRGKVLVQLW